MSTGSGPTGSTMPNLSPEIQLNAHTVQFYEEDSFLLDSLTKLIGTTLMAGDVAFVIDDD